MKKLFTLFLFACLAIKLVAQPTVVTLRPGPEGKNAMLESRNPDLNRADYPNLPLAAWTVDGDPIYIRSLLEFDLSSIPTDANIVEATLNLYYAPLGADKHANTSGSNEAYLMRVTQSWNKTTVTWNNQPLTTNLNQVTLPNSMNATQDYLGIDVSQLVKDMRQFGNYGFMLKLATEQYYRRLVFASGDIADATKHPELIVKYTTATGTAPSSVTNFVGSEVSPLNIQLTWTDNATNEANYIIERSVETPTNFQAISTLAANTNTTTISTGINNKTRYYFRVKAVDANGYYSYSNIISVLTGGIAINDGNKTVCNTYHFDSGVNNPYRSLENFTQTLTPATPGKQLKFALNSLNLTSGDVLSIYDGSTTAATKLYELTLSNIPSDPIIATNAEGKLTLKFTSGDDVSKTAGWEAYVSCEFKLYPPHNIAISQKTATSIELTWADTIASETGFEIQRSENGSAFTTITTTDPNATSYIDNSNIYSGTEYSYRIRTRSTGNISTWSNSISITTQGPAMPTNLAATATAPTTITLNWTDNSSNEDKFILERSITSSSTDFTLLSELAANTTSYVDLGLTPGTQYYYRIKAVTGVYSSNYSSTSILAGAVIMTNTTASICGYFLLDPGGVDNYLNNEDKTMVLTPSEAGKSVKLTFDLFNTESSFDFLYIYDGPNTSSPLIDKISGSKAAPFAYNASNAEGKLTLRFTSDGSGVRSGFKATASCVLVPSNPTALTKFSSTENSITLQWTDNSSSETKFEVYSSQSLNGNYTLAGEVGANVTQFTHNGLVSSTTYFYKVRATNTDAASAFTPVLEAKTGGLVVPTITSLLSPDNQTIIVNWQDNETSETGYKIERSLEANANFAEVGAVAANVTTFSDNTVQFGTTYYYRVYAVNATEESDRSGSSYFVAGSVVMSNTEVTRCNYIIFDSGNSQGNYSNNENITMVLTPSEAEKKVKLTFDLFNTWNTYDLLYIYDGPNTSSPLIDMISGAKTAPFSYFATNAEGKLTLRFTSDGSGVRSGFKASVSCISVPGAPTALAKLAASKNSITLQWTDNSTSETKFEVYSSSTLNGTYTLIGEVGANVTQYTHTGLAAGITYFYKVRATNNDAFSAFTPVLEAKTGGLVVPTITSLLSPDNQTIIVTWQDNETSETGYKVERSLEANANFTEVGAVAANVTTFSDNTVQFGTTYYYRVYAVNATEESDRSVSSYFVAGSVLMSNTTVTRCSYIILDSGNSLGNYVINEDKTMVLTPLEVGKMVKITFDLFDTENSFDFLYIYDGTNTSSPLIDKISGSKTTPFSYYARNAEGKLTLRFTSDGSDVRSGFKATVSCISVPSDPSSLTKFASTNNSITLQWADNSSSETKFEVYSSSTLNGTYTLIGEVGANVTQFTHAGLTTHTTYFYKVKAVNSDASSAFTPVLEATTNGLVTPTQLSLSSPDNQAITISWHDNETTETGYKIERSLEATANFAEVGAVSANVTTFTDNTVQFGTTYYYRVYAVNATEESDRSGSSYFVAGSVIMSNTEVSRCNYIIFDSGNSLGNYSNNETITMVLTPSISGMSIKLSLESFVLQNNLDKLYIYNGNSTSSPLLTTLSGTQAAKLIYANNATGQLTLKFTSDYSTTSEGFKILVDCVYPLIAPTGLTVQSISNNSANLTWNDNNTYEQGYNIYRSTNFNGEFVKVGSVGKDLNTFKDENLTPETNYHYKVKAWSNDDLSAESNTFSTKTTGIRPPTSLTAQVAGNTSITLIWQDNSNSETTYSIERSLKVNEGFSVIGVVMMNTTNYADNYLQSGKTYYYRVQAIDGLVKSDYSNTVTIPLGPNAIADDEYFNGFTLYPNPTEDNARLVFSSDKMGEVDVKVYSTVGTLVLAKIFDKQSTVFSENLDVVNLPNGLYLVKITYKGNTVTVTLNKN